MRKKSDGVRFNNETKSDGVTVHHEKEPWGDSSSSERAMG